MMRRSFPKSIFLVLIAGAAATFTLSAVTTQSKVHEGFETFNKGTFENVGITFDGKIFPTRKLTELINLPASIVWETVIDENGNLIISTGNDGTVYEVDREGEHEVIFQPEEALSKALAVDDKGRIYVGTSPKGRVYRILQDGTQEIFFDPSDLYIWDLKIGADGMVYVATGGRGQVYRIPQDYRMGDDPEVIFEASEIHVNKLAFTSDNSALIVGCGTGGNLYRVEYDGSYYALYHSGADEIKSIFPQEDGSVYFSTFSSKGGATVKNGTDSSDGKKNGDAKKDNPYSFTVFAKAPAESNGLLHLDPNGNVKSVWSLPSTKIFTANQLEDGRWLIGSGSNGRVFRTEGINEWSNVFAVPSGGEVTQIIPLEKEDSLYLVSSNPARVYLLEETISEEAKYTSEVIDTGKMVDWGTLRYLSVTGSFENHVEIQTRSGNIEDPNRSWSEWQPLENGRIQSPNSRFIQYQIHLLVDNPGIQQTKVYYQEQNLHPMIDQIRILKGAYRLFSAPQPSKNVNFSQVFGSSQIRPTNRIPQLVMEKEEGAITAAWLPSDPNNDRLMFVLDVRKVGENEWISVAAELEHPLYAMDIRGLEEGYYQFRVTADDWLDNGDGQSLQYASVSDPYLVDFTSPEVVLHTLEVDDDSVTFSLTVEDQFGIIERAYYSLNGGHVRKAIPVDGMFDSNQEAFEIVIEDLEAGSNSLIFQGYDENGNVGVTTQHFVIE